MQTATNIAEWIVRYSADDLGAPVDPMSLEKLAYYAQSFHLALEDEPLFPDEIEAWKWGPVIPAVYRRYQVFGNGPIPTPEDTVSFVSKKVSEFLTQIVGFFRQHTAVNLSRASHLEEPWMEASSAADNLISQTAMKFYYRALMSEGEVALSRHELLDTIPQPRWASYYVAGICWRKMASHPFYDASLAKKLSEPVPKPREFPAEFYAPVKGRDFIEFSSDENPSDTIKRALS
jgi:uncharacterized phage-associated protein